FSRGRENHGEGIADSSNGGSSLGGGGSSGKRRALRRRQSSSEETVSPVDRAPDLPPPHRPSPPSGDSHSSRGNRSPENDDSRTDVRQKQQDPVVADVELDRGNHREVNGSDTSSSPAEATPSPEQFSDITSSSYASGSAPTLSELGGLPSVSDFSSRVAGSEFSSRGIPASAYDDSVFDSASTWAGASAISVASTNAQSSVFKTPGRGSMLEDTLTAVSEHNTELITTITTKQSSKDCMGSGEGGGGGWTLTENGWVKGMPQSLPEPSSSTSKTATTPFGGRSRKASPGHAPGGTAARRGSQRRSRSDRENGNSQSKPRHLPVPTSTPRRAAMSPHGPAMDAALRMLEDGSLRLGILPEEGGGGADEKEGTERDVAYGNQIAVPPMTSLEQRRQRAKAWAKSRAGGDSHLLRTGAMPALDEHGKEVRKRSPVFSSSGSESEIASSSGTTPARSRTSSRSSTRTTPARSRTNSRGSLGIVTPGRSRAARNSARGLPPQRGTAKNRGGIGGGGPVPRDHRRSPPSENSSGDGKSYRRTSSGSSGGGKSSSGSRRDPEKGGKGGRTEHARRVSAPHSSSSSKSAANGDGEGSGVSGVVGERDEAQSAEGMMKHKKGLYKQSATTAKSMPNMADMLVAPLSRPIPTDSVGYWYNNGQDTEQSSRSRSRSQSATDCETSPVHVAGSGQPSRSRRQNGARPLSYVSKTTGARSNTHPHSLQLDEHANEGMHDDAREARLPSPPPPTALVRGSSTPGKQPKSGAKVGRHHRRKSSGQQSEEDLLALSRSHRAAARDRLNGASSALPSTSKRYQSPPRESDKVKVSARHTKSGGRERKSKHGRHSATKSKEKDSRTSGDDGWKWSANDNPEPTNISGQPDDSATGGRAREDAGNTASHNERNRTKLRGGVSAEGSNGAGPRQASEKTRVAPRESLENDVALNA
ncbi:unnamed protein product, partial [Sphacelaria rigidula]